MSKSYGIEFQWLSCKQTKKSAMDASEPINFLQSHFKTTVSSSCVSDDLYLPENLISSDRQKRELGFMAYSVTKPPVDLEFDLVCGIELLCLKMWTRFGSLKSTGFEIFVSSSVEKKDYRKVGNYFNLTEDGVIFIGCDDDEKRWNQTQFKTVSFFRSTFYSALRNVASVKVSIRQTARCVPVLKRIEIWGRVSKNECEEKRQMVYGTLSTHTKQHSHDKSEETVAENSHTECDNKQLAGISIPECFLDSITYEVMSLPMILPSGKIIDNSTLMKHNLQQEKWGRAPCDPYTGQAFTETRKPILNTALKCQIDKFLLENSNLTEIGLIPRTVGTTSKRKRSDNGDDQSHAVSAKIKSRGLPMSQEIHSVTASSSTLPSTSATALIKSNTLDEAIQHALKTATRFSQRSKDCDVEVKCTQCTDAKSTLLYTIKLCTHFICRDCLVSKNLSLCKCGTKFSNADINKYHRKTFV